MNIEFTKEEYQQLVDLMALGEWMMNAYDVEIAEENEPHRAVMRKVLSHYHDFGADEIVDHAKEEDDYFIHGEYEEKLHEKYVEPYEQETLWDQLSTQLAERDLINELGEDEYDNMDMFDRVAKQLEIEEEYAEEFAENGLENVEIVFEEEEDELEDISA